MIHWLQCWFVVTVPWQPALLSGPSASGPWCRQGKNLTEESKWWSEQSQDGDTSSLFFFCSNVPWSLRSKRSALRARMLKYANGESQREAWGVHRQLHLPLNRRRTVAEWKKISLLRFQFFIWLFALSRSMVKLMLRKVQYAPEGEGVAPSVETTRDFVMSDKPLHVKASLDKEVRCCTNTQNTTWFWHFLPAHIKTFSSCRSGEDEFSISASKV